MGTIKADTVTGLADPNKATIPNTITMGRTTATLNFGNTVIANASAGSTTITAEGGTNTTEYALNKFSKQAARGFLTPNVLRLYGRTSDPFIRDTYTFTETVKDAFPFLRDDILSGSLSGSWGPCMTSIGFYRQYPGTAIIDPHPIMVAKYPAPIMIRPDIDITFVIKIDF